MERYVCGVLKKSLIYLPHFPSLSLAAMNKTVLITGATSGIGKSCAYRFAEKGYQLILLARRTERLSALAQELHDQFGTKTLCWTVDVREEDSLTKVFATLNSEEFPTLDILVNNAGLAAGFGPIDEGATEDWNVMIDTNVKGLLYVTKLVLPFMKKQGFGHIINISSTAAKDVYANGNVYCASKFAVDALTKSMRIDLLNHGIKVTSINPGACETEFSLVRFKGDQERADAVYQGFTPLTPNDVADAVLYTASLPKHVCVNDLTLTCLTQANSNYNIKKII